MIGKHIDHYEVTGTLGEGGMGAVYRARDTMLERDVALKVLRSELASQPELVERFRVEAVTLARLNHPNIATLYGMARHGQDLYMVMEYVPGETVESLVRRSGRLDPFRVVRIGAAALQALDYAHRAGVVHRDIKPANLILAPGDAVKVTDFGIARVFGAAHQTRLGYVVGTLAYMAPEQIMPERFGGQEADGRADLYALGIVLYEMLTGRVPFDAQSDYSLMRAQVEEAPPPPGSLAAVPAALEAVILRALAKAPADRFASAAEFREALLAAETAVQAELPKPTRLAAPLPETRWAASRPAPSSGAAERAPVAAAAPLASALAAGGAQAPPLPGALSQAAKKDMNWRHYTSLAALGVIVVSLIAAYVMRAPDSQPAPATTVPPAAEQGARASSAVPVVPPEAPAAPERVVRPPETPAPIAPVPVPVRPPAGRPPAPPEAERPPAHQPAPPARAVEPPPVEHPPRSAEPVPEPAKELADPAASPTPEPAKPEATDVRGETAVSVPVMSFDKIKFIVVEGKRTRELDARILLTSDRLAIVDDDGGAVLKEFSYASIRGAAYSQSKHPRWKTGLGATAAVGIFAAPLFFMKGTKHWFTLQTDDDFAVLQLDKNNYRVILPAFETRSRIPVERQPDEK